MDYTDNFQQIRQRAIPPARTIRSVITVDGEEIPFDGRFPMEPGGPQRRPEAKTPREEDVDIDGPKTHRVMSLTPRKINVGRDEYIRELGADVWVTGDMARLLEANKLARTIETRVVAAAAPGEAAPAPRPAKPRPPLSNEAKAKKIAALARARQAKKAKSDASAEG